MRAAAMTFGVIILKYKALALLMARKKAVERDCDRETDSLGKL